MAKTRPQSAPPALCSLWANESPTASVQEGFTPWCERTSPQFTWTWHHLQLIRKYLARLTRGEIRKLMILAPPQHGKSAQVTERYPVWRMAREPGLRVAVAAYNQTYAEKLSRAMKRVVIADGLTYGEIEKQGEWELSNGSSLYAVGVGAGITGRSVDLLMIDDPVKSREEADSEAYRDKVWEWYLDDLTTRLQERAAVCLIQTPWHDDDLHGRILASPESHEWTVLKLRALAEDDLAEPDPLGRSPGEPLCPERFSRETLEARRSANPEGFSGLYQLRPVPRGGLFFQREWFPIVDVLPEGDDVKRVRYWDLAATRNKTSCFTAGVLMSRILVDGMPKYFVEDVVRGRWAPAERNSIMRQTAEMDKVRPGYERTWFEEQPGAAGVETSDALVAKFEGLPVRAERVSGDKMTRAIPFSDSARGGQVRILRGDWNSGYIGELAAFPQGAFADQVDSSSGAYAKLFRRQAAWSIT